MFLVPEICCGAGGQDCLSLSACARAHWQPECARAAAAGCHGFKLAAPGPGAGDWSSATRRRGGLKYSSEKKCTPMNTLRSEPRLSTVSCLCHGGQSRDHSFRKQARLPDADGPSLYQRLWLQFAAA